MVGLTSRIQSYCLSTTLRMEEVRNLISVTPTEERIKNPIVMFKLRVDMVESRIEWVVYNSAPARGEWSGDT